jgi:hypothetical protein
MPLLFFFKLKVRNKIIGVVTSDVTLVVIYFEKKECTVGVKINCAQ